MKKLNYLLITFAIFAIACENSFDAHSKNEITLSSKTVEVNFESNEHAINVTSPYSWRAESKNDWISLTCNNGIAGTEELKFVCDRNLDESERKGTIVIKNEDFGLATELYVIQKAFIPKLVINQDNLYFTEKGGSDIIKVSSNFNYSVSNNANWISCNKVEEGVKVTASASDVANERTAQVTIYSEKYNLTYEVEIVQKAFEPEISIDKEELYFDAGGGCTILIITTNSEFSISESADWITCSQNGNSIKITVYASTVIEERCADVIISSDKYNVSKVVKVRQSAFEPYISISTTELIFEAKGGEQNVTISTNCEYLYSTDVDWIKLPPISFPDILSTNDDSSSFAISVSANHETEARCGEITIYNTKYGISKTIRVLQYSFPNGSLSIADLTIVCVDESSNVLNYECSIIDDLGKCIQSFKYGERPVGLIELEPGDYIFKVQSGEIPTVAWDTPVYGVEKAFNIVRGEMTTLSEIVCSLRQIKVTITYAPDLWERLGEKTITTISVGENSLEYSLTECRAGFFSAKQTSNVIFNISGTYTADRVNYKPIDMTHEVRDMRIGYELKIHIYIINAVDGTIGISTRVILPSTIGAD